MKKLILIGIVLAAVLIAQAQAGDLNQLSVLAGEGALKGFTGTTRQVGNTGKQALVNGSKRGFVGGVQLQRQITDKVSIGAQAQTNDTFLGLVGIKF